MKHLFAILLLALAASPALARDPKQVHAFRKTHACPATGKTVGACHGWVVDHLLPLCSGGLDAPQNMQWQSYAASKKKDAREVTFCACLRAHKSACTFKS